LRELNVSAAEDAPTQTGTKERLDDEEELASEDPDNPEETGDVELFPNEPVPDVEEPALTELLSLADALERIPGSLRTEMEDLLRAEFREVRYWKHGNRH